MGLFDWLFGSKSRRITPIEQIWLTDEAFWTSVIAEIVASSNTARIVTAHFPDELGGVVQKLTAKRIPFRAWHVPRTPTECLRELARFEQEVLVTEAWNLPNWTDSPAHVLDAAPAISILQCHHHPLPTEDARVTDFAAALGSTVQMTVFTSLDHPLLRHFAGKEIQKTLRMLGMKEDEAVTHRMVTRQLSNAQRRIAAKVPAPERADTCEAWFERNVRGF